MRMKIEEALKLVGELKKQGYIVHHAFDSDIGIGIPYRTYVIVEGKRQV